MRLERVSANKDSFRPITLQAGFNLILADRTKESTRTDSRNGLGKSTFIEILHFLLGSNLSRGQNLYALRGQDWEFTATFERHGSRFAVSRAIDNTGELVLSGDVSGLTLPSDAKRVNVVRLNTWKQFLGREYFGLVEDDFGGDKYRPSYRALISYFIRPDRGAYLNPFEVRSKQLRWQTQVYNAFLLGLNWRLASDWQRIRDVERTISALGRGSREGLDRFVGRVGELETERVRLQARLTSLEDQVASFRVVPEYEAVEQRVNDLTFEMQELAAENTFESRLARRYEQDVRSEDAATDRLDIDALLRDVGVALPDVTLKSLDEVAEFHTKITENRRAYLEEEASRLRLRVTARRARIDQLESERRESIMLLQSGGALEEFTRLQVLVSGASADVEKAEQRLDEARQLRLDKVEIDNEKKALVARAIIDHDERRPRWSEAIASFAEYSEYLYGTPGALVIEVEETGYDFHTRIEASGSHGRDNMAIFCYDLTLARLWASNRSVLTVHDSELYDPVDERQKALALKLAAAEADARGTQYIAMFNSDQLPHDDLVDAEFDIGPFIRLRLTDTDPAGSLLGIRF